MRILVVGGYIPDQLQSMDRYADLLVRLYQPHGQVSLWRAPGLVSRLFGLPPQALKYLAYIDKLLLFPLRLAFFAHSFDFVHIADHGYAYYSFCCLPSRCIVTCHDLLAVRGAKGDPAAATGSSPIGIWLQRLIMAGLRRSGTVVFDSQATFADYLTLGGGPPNQRHEVIPIPLNAPFNPDPSHFPLSSLETSQVPLSPFLLMVGSALPRKNRILALNVLMALGDVSPYRLILAGAPLTKAEEAIVNQNQLQNRVVSVVRPSHALLNHLYCRAHALLFPSFSEGFGWPLIEAQACACPVIASTTTSIPEVAGAGALFADPSDPSAFAEHVLALEDPVLRRRMIEQGLTNMQKYDPALVSRQLAAFALGSS